MSGLITTRTSRIARRRATVYVVLLIATVACMALSAAPFVRELQGGVGFAFRPLQEAAAGVAGTVGSIAESLRDVDRLRVDNRTLREDNDRLANENARLAALQPEIDRLTELLKVKTGFAYQTIAAAVIGRERPEVSRVMTIDRGTNDGLAVGDVVVAAGGALAGRITDASATAAHVTMINDPKSTVTGMIERSRATGDIVGQLGGVLVMQNIDSTERVEIGDTIVTAGIVLGGGIRSPYPKGLPIGVVFDVQRLTNAVVQTAYLTPMADINKIEYVLIITDYHGGLPPGPTPSASPESQP